MTLRKMPPFGTIDWWRWRNEFIAECYEILSRDLSFTKLPEREYASEFAKRPAKGKSEVQK